MLFVNEKCKKVTAGMASYISRIKDMVCHI